MAGRYIINQTAGKRVVILDEDNDKVEGGYFDTGGVWNEFGGNDEPYPPFVDVTFEVGGLNTTVVFSSPLVIENKIIKVYDGEYSTLQEDYRVVELSSGQTLSLRIYTQDSSEGTFSTFLYDEANYTRSVTDLVNVSYNVDPDYSTNYSLTIGNPFEKASATILYE